MADKVYVSNKDEYYLLVDAVAEFITTRQDVIKYVSERYATATDAFKVDKLHDVEKRLAIACSLLQRMEVKEA